MKKYKHKATGAIAEENNHFMCYTIKQERLAVSLIDRKIIENSNDWEEVKEEIKISNLNVKEEPNYLITAFRSTKDKSLARINALGLYDFGIPLKDFLHGDNSIEDGKWEIYSVKNSKGEEFTIGEVIGIFGVKFKIDKFEIIHNVIMVYFIDGNNCILNDIEKIKVKTPIYTTTDGVDIYEGDRIWLSLLHKDLSLHENDLVLVGNFSKQDNEVADRYLTFTSEENRDKYIKENTKKPVFVSADGVDMFSGEEIVYVITNIDAHFESKLKNIIPCLKTDYKYFSSEQERREYVDNNKTKYSLADIEKAYNQTQSPTTSPLFQNFKSELKKLGK